MITEFEAKFLNIDRDSLHKQLIKIGAIKTTEQKLMRRKIFDLPAATSTKQWVRVRDENNKITLTLKRVSDSTRIDGTQELEFSVDDFDKANEFLTLCGLIPQAYQENYRENWSYQEAIISIDTWPGLPAFLEIEARDECMVRSIAQELRLDFQKSYFGTVDMIYEQTLNIPAQIFNHIKELTFATISHTLNTLSLEHHEK